MSIKGFEEWLQTPQGSYVLNWELSKHDLLLADVFGFNAVQVGLPGIDYLRANRMPLRFRCGGEIGDEVLTDLHHLPLASQSVDLIVLPHVLEFDENPHQVLREVERVLVPEGQAVVTGFNPFSLWGMKRRINRQPEAPPWVGRYISVPRLKDWFVLLGFETRAGAFGCYAPAVSEGKWLRRYRFMEPAGDRWWPFAGAVYIVQAIKRHHGLRLLTPKWHDRIAQAKALAAVTPQISPNRSGTTE